MRGLEQDDASDASDVEVPRRKRSRTAADAELIFSYSAEDAFEGCDAAEIHCALERLRRSARAQREGTRGHATPSRARHDGACGARRGRILPSIYQR